MTTLSGASSRTPLRSIQRFKEDPRIKKMARSFAGDSREDVWGVLASVSVCLMETLIFALIFSAFILGYAYVMHQHKEPWVITANIIMFSLVLPVAVIRNRAHINWLLKGEDSSLVENKTRRSVIKRSRQAAKRLGSSIIPVLTEDHVASVERVYKAMTTAAAESHIKPDARDHDRLTVLLFENINREHALLSIINDQGLFTAKEIEAALRDMESHTVGPVQSGWL
jgi:hypothetical protein